MHRFIILSITQFTPSFPGLSIGYRDTRMAASLSADCGGSDREIFATLRHVPDAYRTTVCVKEGSPRYGRLPVRTATGRVLFLRFLRLSDGGEREVGRSVRPSGWDPDARRICPPTARRRLLLSFASPPSPPPCPPPSRRSPSLRNRAPPWGLLHRFLSHPAAVCLFSSSYTTSVVTPPALPPSSASSCRYRYHYHCPRHYHRRGGVDDASSSAFSWPSPPAESTWWLPHHLGDPAPLSTNDQRLSLLRGANRAHGSSRDLSPLCSWASILSASLLIAYAVSSEETPEAVWIRISYSSIKRRITFLIDISRGNFSSLRSFSFMSLLIVMMSGHSQVWASMKLNALFEMSMILRDVFET